MPLFPFILTNIWCCFLKRNFWLKWSRTGMPLIGSSWKPTKFSTILSWWFIVSYHQWFLIKTNNFPSFTFQFILNKKVKLHFDIFQMKISLTFQPYFNFYLFSSYCLFVFANFPISTARHFLCICQHSSQESHLTSSHFKIQKLVLTITW